MIDVALAREGLDVVSGKWVLHVIGQLADGPKRYTELHDGIEGVSGSMLTRTLRRMQRDGMIARTVHPAIPPQVEYRLTALGESIDEPLGAIARWAERHGGDVQAARRSHRREP